MLHLRKALPALQPFGFARQLSTASAGRANAAGAQADDRHKFELLPEGCSMADPTYALKECVVLDNKRNLNRLSVPQE